MKKSKRTRQIYSPDLRIPGAGQGSSDRRQKRAMDKMLPFDSIGPASNSFRTEATCPNPQRCGAVLSCRIDRCLNCLSCRSQDVVSSTGFSNCSFLEGALNRFLSGIFSANERFIRPDIEPVTIAPAVSNADIIEISVHGSQCVRSLQVEDNLGVSANVDISVQNLILLAQNAGTLEIRYHGGDMVFGSHFHGAILIGIIDLRLDAAAALGNYVRRKHMGITEAREKYVAVVEIGPLPLREV